MSIHLLVNDKPLTFETELSLSQAINQWELIPNTFAIAINNVFIPKKLYGSTILKQNDHIEIVSAMQGG